MAERGHGNGPEARPDLRALLANPAQAAEVPADAVPTLLLEAAVEQSRLSAVTSALAASLAAKPPEERLWTAKEVAAYLHVGVDWVRDHGEAKGIAVPLSVGTVRYRPERVRALRANGGRGPRPD